MQPHRKATSRKAKGDGKSESSLDVAYQALGSSLMRMQKGWRTPCDTASSSSPRLITSMGCLKAPPTRRSDSTISCTKPKRRRRAWSRRRNQNCKYYVLSTTNRARRGPNRHPGARHPARSATYGGGIERHSKQIANTKIPQSSSTQILEQ